MVRTPAMTEAEVAGGRFEGVVATVNTPDGQAKIGLVPTSSYFRLARIIRILAPIAPYVILKVLTGFETAGSTKAQRVWTMVWLVFGQVAGISGAWYGIEARNGEEDEWDPVLGFFWTRALRIYTFFSLFVFEQVLSAGSLLLDKCWWSMGIVLLKFHVHP
jgi:hypothetical protein